MNFNNHFSIGPAEVAWPAEFILLNPGDLVWVTLGGVWGCGGVCTRGSCPPQKC